MNDALTKKPISDVSAQALLAAQFQVWPRRFWTDAPQIEWPALEVWWTKNLIAPTCTGVAYCRVVGGQNENPG
jgi:hypothetical protein